MSTPTKSPALTDSEIAAEAIMSVLESLSAAERSLRRLPDESAVRDPWLADIAGARRHLAGLPCKRVSA
jgi:hypothetical protein